MQRRATAVSVAVFLLIAAGSFAFIGATQAPDIEVQADRTLSANDEFSVGGIQYNVSSLSDGSASLAWTNQTARYTASLANDSNVTYRNETYHLLVEQNVSDPSTFTLREVQNVSRILANDPDVYDRVYTSDGEKYVRYRSNDSLQSLPAYLPDPRTETFAEGNDYPYQNQTTTVAAVSNTSVTLEWIAPRANSISVSEGSNVTLGESGTRYVAHFPDANTLVLSQDFEGYQSSLDAQAYYQERINGLWGVSIVSGLAAVLLVMFSYLPSRY